MPIETRGKKDPALAAAIKAGRLPAEAPTYDYVVGRKPLRVGTETRMPGDPIPEAASWPRLESWLRSGAVEQRPAGSVQQRAAEPQEDPDLEPADGVLAGSQRQVDEDITEANAQAAKPAAGLRPRIGQKETSR